MTRKRYTVDWSDHAYPKIVECDPDCDWEDQLTFGEAKREIIDHFRAQIAHARYRIREARALRVADLEGKTNSRS